MPLPRFGFERRLVCAFRTANVVVYVFQELLIFPEHVTTPNHQMKTIHSQANKGQSTCTYRFYLTEAQKVLSFWSLCLNKYWHIAINDIFSCYLFAHVTPVLSNKTRSWNKKYDFSDDAIFDVLFYFNRKMLWFALRAFSFRNSLKPFVIFCMHQVYVTQNINSP